LGLDRIWRCALIDVMFQIACTLVVPSPRDSD